MTTKDTKMVLAITLVLMVSIIPMAAAQEQPSWACWAVLRTCHSDATTEEEFMRTCCPYVVDEMIARDRECFCLVKPQLPQNPGFAEDVSNLLSMCNAPSFETICPDSASNPNSSPSPSPDGVTSAPPPSSTPSQSVSPSAQPPSSNPTADATPSALPPGPTPSTDVTPSAQPPGSTPTIGVTPSTPPPGSTPSADVNPSAPPTPPTEDEASGLVPPPSTTTPAAGDLEDQQNAANKMGMTGSLSGLLILFTFNLFIY